MLQQLKNISPWRVLALLCIIFASGTSGGWLSTQFHDPLPFWWGWYGSTLLGVSMFGGVVLAVRGNSWGRIIVGVCSVVAIIFDYQYFTMPVKGLDGELLAITHTPLVTVSLASFSTIVAIICGIVEGQTGLIRESKIDNRESQELQHRQRMEALQLELQAQQTQAARDLELRQLKMQLDAQVKIASVHARSGERSPEQEHRSTGVQVNGGERSGEQKLNRGERLNVLLTLMERSPNATLNELRQGVGQVSKTTVHNDIQHLQTVGAVHRNGEGWEVKRE